MILISGCSKKNDTDPVYAAEITKWHNGRIENLKKENGWLNLAGLFWLKKGENSFGSDKSNDIIFPQDAPAQIGKIIVDESGIRFLGTDNVEVTVNGNKVKDTLLQTDISGHPSVMMTGSYKWFIIKRGEKLGIRLRDLNSPLVKNFAGIETFDIDKGWRIEATYRKFPAPKIIKVPTILGTIEDNKVDGELTFSKDGKNYSLIPVVEDGSYFLIFADETNGEETYGSGRFLYTTFPDLTGKVILDFNKAYNPPCSFTKYATCPLPPKENYLHLKVTAGEKKYGEEH
jgi:hypothetical protein